MKDRHSETTVQREISFRRLELRKLVLAALAIATLVAFPALAGQYHSGATLFCYDCHTPHHSMQHGYSGGAVNTDPGAITGQSGFGGDWMPAGTPNDYLLKLPANELCLACHDGQSFAPDVHGDNTNPTYVRSAGATNGSITGHAPGAAYSDFMGHTLGSASVPPGYDPAVIGATPTWYTGTTNGEGLRCIDCHAQHGPATSYRNLGSYSPGGTSSSYRPTYYFSTTADSTTTSDVRINLASYTAGSGNAATFGPYYDAGNIQYQRNDLSWGTTKTSNAIDTFCATCHGDFHGGTGDANIGGGTAGAGADGFLRHPTSYQTIGAATAGGHSSLTRYVANKAKVPVYTSNHTTYADATPGCLSCHKAHGNQNPFGLLFTAGNQTTPPTEQGTDGITDSGIGQRNLCGQCHSQGAKGTGL